jgi:hypothetical protein
MTAVSLNITGKIAIVAVTSRGTGKAGAMALVDAGFDVGI